jgi:hypothetical protein
VQLCEARIRSQDPTYRIGYWDGYNGREPYVRSYWTVEEAAMYRLSHADGIADAPKGQKG